MILYNSPGVDYTLDGLADVVRTTTEALRQQRHAFDSIAVSGTSGLVVGAPVALRLRKPLVVIRKPEDGSHARKGSHVNTSRAGKRVLFLDDFVSSGRTRSRVINALVPLGAHVVAMYEYGRYVDREPAGRWTWAEPGWDVTARRYAEESRRPDSRAIETPPGIEPIPF